MNINDAQAWPQTTAFGGEDAAVPTAIQHTQVDLSLRIRVPAMVNTRRSSAIQSDHEQLSDSEYHASEHDGEGDEDADGEPEDLPLPEPEPEVVTSKRGRAHAKVNYQESDPDDDFDDGAAPRHAVFDAAPKRSLRTTRRTAVVDEDDDEEEPQPRSRRPVRSNSSKNLPDFVESDEDAKMHEEFDDGSSRRSGRLRRTRQLPKASSSKPPPTNGSQRTTRRSARIQKPAKDDDYIHGGETSGSGDADGSLDEDELDLAMEPEPEPEPEDDNDGKPYALRQRQRINYAIPPPIEEMRRPPPKPPGGGRHRGGPKKNKGLGWSASGAELGRWMGMPGDDSDSDNPTRTPRKPFGVNPFGGGAVAAGGILPGDLAAAGTPSNLGKIGDAALADADPLGVNTNVTFDEVGGLDEHIHSLKEMTLLPLLYPEVFQRFNVTPPRGVLFHGPPGTGKTLLARALAASSRSGGRQISFFMRKGADCLSKWVGEAERQLRLLFEEAKNSQPSIIFFDEIDGLAPVRSSKQDQIHASIVSTLLALMDGMDGRGQVIVIGATNRPDAVDPALRRPGRFDREFYFGLPGLDAREKILGIMTKKWENWDPNQEGEKGVQVKEKLHGLAKLTKGYGGADLRALCTEAALNAIQRRYPQVYKSQDRLLLKPETIDVGLRDFMMSIKKIVPSSARSTTSAATALPPQFEPLLSETLEQVKNTIQRVMPVEKPLTALEEAEFEDVGGEDSALEREMLSQAMQTLRVYRPRVIIHGSVGMGQGYIGAAALHHLEGYHVQSLELGSLMSDSTRTVEAAIVQLFVEAKRHQPSVIYIPSLFGWCAAVSETSRSTVRAMLETLLPTDPILLLAVVDGPFAALPKDVKSWFGPSRDNRVQLLPPSAEKRAAFFEPLLKDVARKPNEFADGVKRRKRILEELPIAPPLEPRKPTAAELALQEENDQKSMAILKFRLGPILAEMKRKFKRFTKRATEEYNFEPNEEGIGYAYELDATAGAAPVPQTNGVIDISGDGVPTQPVKEPPQAPVEQVMLQRPILYDIDLDRMHNELYRGHYFTPQDFLDDVGKMVHNADVRAHEDLDRLHKAQAMFTAAQVSLLEFDAGFRMECERMKARERQRRDERRKEKGKEREKDGGGSGEDRTDGIQTRRSTRNNGAPADLISMTDPVKLERRLKRQREAGENSGAERDTSASAEEAGLGGAGGQPHSKRSKMVLDDDEDELRTPMSHARHNVRFAPAPGMPHFMEPIPGQGQNHLGPPRNFMPSGSPMTNYQMHHQHHPQHLQQPPSQPIFHPGHPQHPQHQQHPQHFQPQPNHNFPPQHYNAQPPPQPHFLPSDHMVMDGHDQRGHSQHGFDPTLLNPVQSNDMSQGFNGHMGFSPSNERFNPAGGPTSPLGPHPNLFNGAGPSGPMQNNFGPNPPYPQQQFHQPQIPPPDWQQQQPQQSTHQQQGRSLPHMPVFNDDPNDPFSSPAQPQRQHQGYLNTDPQQTQHQVQQLQVPQPPQQQQAPSPSRLTSILRASRTPEPERRPTPTEGAPSSVESAAAATAGEKEKEEPVAMVVERSPSPPLPDFHIDEDLLQELRDKLKDTTGSLSIEQLEQLRATCLGEVWRQRKEWDRDPLVKALLKSVDEFLEEVKELEEWDEE
ncbi:hypothetical protein D9611_002981 [Ephemerocybe angulata]|uniref:AAA+ ATPase domain-containing protein n=1 Tax=Ephemerocybe angulata TaxID=980116 RepID=A0A8H5CA60_9AGAR|nr:hypothetical protein D9611_002981 [Tulosesus angulatus]